MLGFICFMLLCDCVALVCVGVLGGCRLVCGTTNVGGVGSVNGLRPGVGVYVYVGGVRVCTCACARMPVFVGACVSVLCLSPSCLSDSVFV